MADSKAMRLDMPDLLTPGWAASPHDFKTPARDMARPTPHLGAHLPSATIHDADCELSELDERQTTELLMGVAVNSLDVTISVWDRQSHLIKYNDGFLELLPSPTGQQDIRGMRYGDLIKEHILPQVDIDAMPRDGRMLLSSSTAARTPASGLELPLKDGRWLLVRKRDLPSIGTVAMTTDITDLKRKEDEARAQRAELESKNAILEALTEALRTERDSAEKARRTADEANAAKSRFLAHMSHELRTPLNAILGFSELIKQETFGPLGDQKYCDYAQYILQSGEHLLSLINDVLDMSRIEASKFVLRREQVALDEIIEEAGRLANEAVSPGVVRIRARSDIAAIRVHADRRALLQMLVNLLTNALKFTHGATDVYVSVKSGAAYTRISVLDRGVGMTRAEVQQAMTPFSQIEGYVAKNQLGTGLGLPLVHGLIEAHGGFIKIRSQPKRGTVASLFLPA